MKLFAIFVTLMEILAFSARPAHAQQGDSSRNYDFVAPMYTVVDVAQKGWFSGWSGNCNTGRQPLSVMLWRIDPTTHQAVNVPVTVSTGTRPDAQAWLQVTCGRPFDGTLGWSLVPVLAEPPGAFTYVVLVTDVPASWCCRVMPVGYPNAGQMVCDYAANTVYRIVQ